MLAPVRMSESPNHDKLRRLLDIRRILASESDYERLLERVLEEGRAITGARYAALGVLDQERAGLERFSPLGSIRSRVTRLGSRRAVAVCWGC